MSSFDVAGTVEASVLAASITSPNPLHEREGGMIRFVLVRVAVSSSCGVLADEVFLKCIDKIENCLGTQNVIMTVAKFLGNKICHHAVIMLHVWLKLSPGYPTHD